MRYKLARFRAADQPADLCWHSQLQMPVLKQLARLAGCFFRLLSSSCRSASGIRAGAGLRARLQVMYVVADQAQDARFIYCHPPSFEGHDHRIMLFPQLKGPWSPLIRSSTTDSYQREM